MDENEKLSMKLITFDQLHPHVIKALSKFDFKDQIFRIAHFSDGSYVIELKQDTNIDLFHDMMLALNDSDWLDLYSTSLKGLWISSPQKREKILKERSLLDSIVISLGRLSRKMEKFFEKLFRAVGLE